MADIGGVEFLIELNAKLDQAVKMTKVLTQTEAAVVKADAAMRKAEKSVGLFNRALGYLSSKGGEILKNFLGHFTALAAWDFSKRMVSKGYDMGKSLLMAAAGAEKTSRAFENLFGQDAQMMEDKADQIAKVTKHSDDQVKDTMQELGAAGLQPQQIVDTIMVAADAAARTGKESAFHSTVMAAKMMQTMNRLPPGRALQNLGLPPGAAKEMQKQIKGGTLALQAFMNVVGKTSKTKVFEAAIGAGKDLDVTFSKLAGLPEQYGQKLAKTAGYEKIKEAFAGLLKAFDPDSENGKKIFTALEKMLGSVGEVLKTLDVKALTVGFVQLVGVLPAIVRDMSSLAGFLVSILNTFLKMDAWSDRMNAKNRAGGNVDLSKPPSEATVKEAGHRSALAKWFGVPGDVSAGARQKAEQARFDEQAFRAGKGWVVGMKEGEVSALPQLTKTGDVVVKEGIVAPVTEGLQLHSPSRVLQRLGAQTAAGFALGISGAVPALERSVSEAFSPGALLGGSGVGMAGAAAAVAGRGTSSGPQLSADITVNISGTGGDGAAREIAEASGAAIREALAAWMDEMAAQGAAS